MLIKHATIRAIVKGVMFPRKRMYGFWNISSKYGNVEGVNVSTIHVNTAQPSAESYIELSGGVGIFDFIELVGLGEEILFERDVSEIDSIAMSKISRIRLICEGDVIQYRTIEGWFSCSLNMGVGDYNNAQFLQINQVNGSHKVEIESDKYTIRRLLSHNYSASHIEVYDAMPTNASKK